MSSATEDIHSKQAEKWKRAPRLCINQINGKQETREKAKLDARKTENN